MTTIYHTIAANVLSAMDRRGELPALPAGNFKGMSFTLNVTCAGVAVEDGETYTATVAVPLTAVLGAVMAEAEKVNAALLSAVAEKAGPMFAAEVLGMIGAESPSDLTARMLAAASARATGEEGEALAAAGAEWADGLKKVVQKKGRKGRAHVKSAKVTVAK